MSTALKDAMNRYLDRCRRRELSASSMHNYASALRKFAELANTHGHTLVSTLDRQLVEHYLDHLADEGQTKRTQAHRLQVLRQFISFARVERLINRDPTEGLRLRWRPKRVTAPEMSALVTMVQRIPADGSWLDVRDRAILMLTLETALRVSEVAWLDVPGPTRPVAHTVDLARREAVVKAKGGESQPVVFSETTARALDAWLRVRAQIDTGRSPALFLSRRKLRMTRATLHVMVRRRAEAAGIAQMHYHLLRHRRIGDVVERLGIQMGQALARHQHASTTVNVYGHHAQRVVRERLQAEAAITWGEAA